MNRDEIVGLIFFCFLANYFMFEDDLKGEFIFKDERQSYESICFIIDPCSKTLF